ncbi:MAG TPA: prepilin-type N-terminal cleavage/methylation domain-containing protein [Thermoanaerobaculia bacterium]|nr:prepilin-type N-terminal cleavage/methylation domain-containing protein [Thermoanaerobaculia bacterium]
MAKRTARRARGDHARRYRRERAVVNRERGFTLMEIVVVLAVFGAFLWIVVVLTADMRAWQKRMPVNFMTHPAITAVVSRLRKDVQDAAPPYYRETYGNYSMSNRMLIVYTLKEAGTGETVVWDFSTDGEVTRRAFTDISGATSTWTAHGTPTFSIGDFPIPGSPDSVRIQATDKDGKLAIDQIYQPRPH